MTTAGPRRLSASDLAALAGTTLERPGADGLYEPGDVHRLRIMAAFMAAGIPSAALAEAVERNAVSFEYYDQLHPAPGMPSERTYGELKQDLGERGTRLEQLITTLALAEPDDASRSPKRRSGVSRLGGPAP